jgi:flavin reductase (DIM6/NTAB) family NADH-FMN oxidoreductase RutF
MKWTRSVAIFLALVMVLAPMLAEAQQKAAAEVKKSLGAKTIAPPVPVWIIGTYDKDGKPNVMTASWVGICCSNPPCVMISLRDTRHSYSNLMGTGAFTVNIPSVEQADVAAYVGTVSGRDRDKFADCGLTPVASKLVNAPYVKEFQIVLECMMIRTLPLGSHTMFVGEIKDVKVDPSILSKDGSPTVEKFQPFVFCSGDRGFYRVTGYLGSILGLSGEIKPKQ